MADRATTLRRRLISVPALFAGAILLVVTIPLWLPLAGAFDLVRGRLRLPTVRLLAFGVCWTWLESCGVIAAGAMWCVGLARNERLHWGLQRWWAANLMAALRRTTGITVNDVDTSALKPGPAVLLCRHASLADSLLSAWIITSLANMQPRYVLKRELLVDPCLDIVGNRLPNYFLDREATDSAAELASLEQLSSGLTEQQIAVIFPEGTRSAPHKRTRAIDKIRERDPERGERVAALQHLLPVRPAGSIALLRGRPDADVVVGWHTGFDGLDTFGGILRHLAHRPAPVQFRAIRFARLSVPSADSPDFARWLDDRWLEADRSVHTMLHPEQDTTHS